MENIRRKLIPGIKFHIFLFTNLLNGQTQHTIFHRNVSISWLFLRNSFYSREFLTHFDTYRNFPRMETTQNGDDA